MGNKTRVSRRSMSPPLPLSEDLRPRDFTARHKRAAMRGIQPRRRHHGRRAAVLLAAIAVPAVAAPSHWGFDIGNAGAAIKGGADVAVQPMPFEQPGNSFPGSAFYYLAADAPQQQQLGDGIHSDADDAPTGLDSLTGPGIGGAARALRIDNSGVDRSRAVQCLTAAIYYEAESEPDAGQRAVAQVVLNRVAHPAYPKTVCGVVYQGSEKSTGCQFSFSCDGALARVPNRLFWERAAVVARDALSGYVYSPVGLATHYHTVAVHPYWAPSLNFLGTIGAHRFYSFRGPAGRAATFNFAYAGGEPLAAPHVRDARADLRADTALDPLAIERAYAAGLKAAVVPAAAGGVIPVRVAPLPTYSTEQLKRGGDALYRSQNLPEATGIRPEYQNSGQWISQPTS
jgi:spore germination cell wall hydrolase CwlJ-like protein